MSSHTAHNRTFSPTPLTRTWGGWFAILLTPLFIFNFSFFISSCSTTKNLPEDEQLYVGIDDIVYNGNEKKKKKKNKAAANDSVGVITSIGNAVDAVNQVLSGGSVTDFAETLSGSTGVSPVDEKAQKEQTLEAEKEAEAFETAKEEIDAVLAYAPNNSLFGSSSHRTPFPVGLWIYNGTVNSKTAVGKWIFKTFAATPIYISTVNPTLRARVATNTLHNYGYFSGNVTATVLPQRNPRKAKVTYRVNTGKVHRLDSIAYIDFPARADSLLRATMSQSYLHSGDAFNVVNLANEQTRIEELFRENGYYYYSSGYTTYQADTLQRKNRVQLRVLPSPDRPDRVHRQWYIGRTYVSVRRSETEVLDKTLERRNFTYNYGGEKIPLRIAMWRRAMTHRRGELFRLSDSNSTLEKLGSMGLFSQLDVNYVQRDTSSTCDTLDVYVTAVMDKLFDSSFEMNATMKSNQQVGPGVSYSIAKRNAFGGGEKVAFKIFGSYEWQTHNTSGTSGDLLNSYELGTELSFEFPRFILPGFSRRRLRMPATTTYAINADWRNRASFYQMVSFGADVTYKWYRRDRSNAVHELTPFSLDFDKVISKTATFDSIMTANPALYVSMRSQFVPSASYTFTYSSSASHRNPVWFQFSVKEAGNIVSGLYAATGKKFNEKNKNLFGSPFAQFVKATLEFHETIRFNSTLKLATRVFGGIIYSYGNADRAPYADQFYVGGANSVRAFTVRTIGPGAYRAADSKYAYLDQTGDVKLEANVELRAKLFGSLHGAVFLDAGNVWLLRADESRPDAALNASTIKHIAVGTGAGLRYDLNFLVLRFDVGIGLHAPYRTSKSGFYNLERFRDGLAFHFAIGYPF